MTESEDRQGLTSADRELIETLQGELAPPDLAPARRSALLRQIRARSERGRGRIWTPALLAGTLATLAALWLLPPPGPAPTPSALGPNPGALSWEANVLSEDALRFGAEELPEEYEALAFLLPDPV